MKNYELQFAFYLKNIASTVENISAPTNKMYVNYIRYFKLSFHWSRFPNATNVMQMSKYCLDFEN